MRLKAIIFDVDGTLAETEETHRAAFNRAFAEAGIDWNWSEDDYRALLTTTGGRERIARHMRERSTVPDPALIASLHTRKNAIYAALVADGTILPRPGVVTLIGEARSRGIRLAIATTTSRANLTALLTHSFAPDAERWFAAIVAGEDVQRKKPHPEAYQKVLGHLALGPAACVAIEDSRNGLDAALGAGLKTVIVPSRYFCGERFRGASHITDVSTAFNTIDVSTLEALLNSGTDGEIGRR